ncbi:MAG: hypothetical protein LC772_10850, partial [Chloroflexi bacterium]|nr:hypothetical protein [Chloroflexota bacterium]
MTLELRLLGCFETRVDGARVREPRSRVGKWLLALLALRSPREIERTRLAATLWPDSGEQEALYNLRRNLSDLRRVLGPEAGRIQSPSLHTVRLDLNGAFCDVTEFDRAAGAGENPEEAIALYRGPLLEECDAEWVLPERRRREESYVACLEALAERDDGVTAIRLLRQVLEIEPFREPALRRCMEALADSGDDAGVAELYRSFRLRLVQELASEPAAETTALFHRLRRDARVIPSSSPSP